MCCSNSPDYCAATLKWDIPASVVVCGSVSQVLRVAALQDVEWSLRGLAILGCMWVLDHGVCRCFHYIRQCVHTYQSQVGSGMAMD